MLTQEELIKGKDILTQSDSVFDAIVDISDSFNRTITKEEVNELLNYVIKCGSEAQNEPKRRTSYEATQPVNKVTRMQELANQIAETYRRKNMDYGDSFGISVRKYGIVAALTRMSDKWNRLENLILHREKQVTMVADESLLDTLLDMATYCMMTIIEIENE